MDTTTLHAKNPKDLWRRVYERVFPQEVDHSFDPIQSLIGILDANIFILGNLFVYLQNTSDHKEPKDPAKDPQYSEPQIDAMRAQKDQVAHLDQAHAGVLLPIHL